MIRGIVHIPILFGDQQVIVIMLHPELQHKGDQAAYLRRSLVGAAACPEPVFTRTLLGQAFKGRSQSSR